MRELVMPRHARPGSRRPGEPAGQARRRRLTAGAAVLFATVLAVVLAACGNSTQTAAATRQYTASQACLLTGSRGISSQPAATVWAGMEDASQATNAKVTYLAVNGPATTDNAIPYANSLIEQHCGLVLAVGTPQTSAISQIAARTPKTNFVIVSSETDFSTANLKTVSLAADTRNEVKQEVESLVNS